MSFVFVLVCLPAVVEIRITKHKYLLKLKQIKIILSVKHIKSTNRKPEMQINIIRQ